MARFTSEENKKKVPRINWVSDYLKARVLMPNGKWVKGYVEGGVRNLKIGDVIQLERFGFVRFDGIQKKRKVGAMKKESKTKNGGVEVVEFWFAHG